MPAFLVSTENSAHLLTVTPVFSKPAIHRRQGGLVGFYWRTEIEVGRGPAEKRGEKRQREGELCAMVGIHTVTHKQKD